MIARPSNHAGPHRPPQPAATILADELLTWPALRERLGWGARTLARAQADGLQVLRYGRQKYVMGRSLIEFLENVNRPAEQQAAGEQQEAVQS